MINETVHGYKLKTASYVLIFLICVICFPKTGQAIGVNLEGITTFDGIPAGVIRDIEVSGRVVYVAAENGVFEVIGRESKRLNYNISNHSTGIISDIHLSDASLWVVEYGVGVFEINLRTKEAKQLFTDEEWSRSVWAMAMTPINFYFSAIDDVIQVNRELGHSTKLSFQLTTLNLNGVYSLFAEKDKVFIASDKGYFSILETSGVLEENLLSDKLPLLSSVTFIKVIDKELYIGGPEGLYILGSKKRYVSTEGVSGTYINDVIKTADNNIWVSDGRLLILQGRELVAPPFMNPVLTSEAIRTITKIAVGPYDSLLIASSQLGLISLPETMLSTNLVSLNGSALRENIQKSAIDKAETLVRIESGLFNLNENNGELIRKGIEQGNVSHCVSRQEEVFARLVELSPSELCSRKFIHSVEIDNNTFYFYFDDGSSASYYYIVNGTIKDTINAPRKIVYSTLLSGGELAAFDVFDNVHFQLSKFSWRTINSQEGSWFGLQCLVEYKNVYLLCTSGAGLQEIDKKSGSVKVSTVQGLSELRFIRGAMISESGNLWVASNMGLFIKPRSSESASKVGLRFGLFDSDFEYRSFEELRTKVLVKGDKYSYLLDEKELIQSLKSLPREVETTVLTHVKWNDEKGRNELHFPEHLNFKFDSGFKEISFNFVDSDVYSKSEGIEFKLDDNAWFSHNKTSMSLTLGDLDFGSHTLNVISSHNRNTQNGLTIKFDIAPPLWASKWGIILYLSIGILFFLLMEGWDSK